LRTGRDVVRDASSKNSSIQVALADLGWVIVNIKLGLEVKALPVEVPRMQ
jgi:hypothetical protein